MVDRITIVVKTTILLFLCLIQQLYRYRYNMLGSNLLSYLMQKYLIRLLLLKCKWSGNVYNAVDFGFRTRQTNVIYNMMMY